MAETNVVNRRDSSFDTYIGRKKQDGEFKHLANTTVDESGWLGNPAVMESNAKSAHRNQGDIVIVSDRTEAVAFFERVFRQRLVVDPEFREAVQSLAGGSLGCWCSPKACHGDVIAHYLNENRTDWHDTAVETKTSAETTFGSDAMNLP